MTGATYRYTDPEGRTVELLLALPADERAPDRLTVTYRQGLGRIAFEARYAGRHFDAVILDDPA